MLLIRACEDAINIHSLAVAGLVPKVKVFFPPAYENPCPQHVQCVRYHCAVAQSNWYGQPILIADVYRAFEKVSVFRDNRGDVHIASSTQNCTGQNDAVLSDMNAYGNEIIKLHNLRAD